MIVEEWRIDKTSTGCSSCTTEFQVGEPVYSSIVETDSTFERKDSCARCWGEEAARGAFSFWKTKVVKVEKESRRFDMSQVRHFFDRLAGSGEPHHQDLAYLLALLLMRKRRLTPARNRAGDGDVGDQGKVLHLMDPKDQRSYRIAVPDLTEERIAELNEEMSGLLSLPSA